MTDFVESMMPRHGRVRPLWAAGVFLLVAGLSLTLPFIFQAVLFGIVLAMFLCWLLPFWSQWNLQTLDYFEPIHTVGFVYFVYFGLGSLLTVASPSKVAYDRYVLDYIPMAAFYCLLGYLVLLAGYYLPWHGRREHRSFEEVPRGVLFLILPAGLGFMGFMALAMWYKASRLGLSLAGLISSMGQLAPLFIFAWAMAWLLYFGGRATRSVRILLFFFMIPATGLIVLNNLNNKSMTVSLAVVPLMALWYAKRKIPWATLIVLGLIVVFVVFPFNNTYRALDNRMTTGQRLEVTTQMIGDWNLEHYLDRSVGTFGARMALVNSVAVVLRDVPRWVPYAKGDTIFLPTMVFFVPRFIWPEKPALAFGREFGETFRVVHILDQDTNIAVTVPGELLWNFGLPGLLFGMAIWGVILRLYYRAFGESRDLDPIRRAIHLVLLIQILHFESGIAFSTVMIVRTLLVLEVYRFVGRRFSLTERVDPRDLRTGAVLTPRAR